MDVLLGALALYWAVWSVQMVRGRTTISQDLRGCVAALVLSISGGAITHGIYVAIGGIVVGSLGQVLLDQRRAAKAGR